MIRSTINRSQLKVLSLLLVMIYRSDKVNQHFGCNVGFFESIVDNVLRYTQFRTGVDFQLCDDACDNDEVDIRYIVLGVEHICRNCTSKRLEEVPSVSWAIHWLL